MSNVICLFVGRTEIEDMDFGPLIDKIRELHTAENNCIIIIGGYEKDPRALWEIPEVCNWFEKSLDTIPWFYVLHSREGFTNQYELLIICSALYKVIDHKPLINPSQIKNVYGKCFACLDAYCEANSIPPEANVRCVDRAFDCLCVFLKKWS